MCRVTFSAVDCQRNPDFRHPAGPAKINETRDSKQGEGGEFLWSGGWTRHHVITPEHMGVGLPKA